MRVIAPLPGASTGTRDARLLLDQQPTFEVLEVEDWAARFPLDMQTDTRNPKMVFVSARETRNGGASVQCSVPSFGRTADGIRIPAVTGLTAGTRYDVTILVLGAN